MPTLTLAGKNNVRIEFVPEARGGWVRIEVESERPIRAFILDGDGMDEFDSDDLEPFTTLAGSDTASKYHELRAFIPRNTEWYLLLVNNRDRSTAVHWRFV